jgi:ankyrin repeat protein
LELIERHKGCVDINKIGRGGSTLLHHAVSASAKGRECGCCCCTEVADALLDIGADINSAADNGDTPLHHASSHGVKTLLSLLLDRGANVNAVNNQGYTPLMHLLGARRRPSTPASVSSILIQRNADLNIQNSNGNTALHIMMCSWTFRADAEIVTLLVDNDADIFARNKFGLTPADIACRYKRIEAGAFLRERMEEARVLRESLKNAMTAEDDC